ncbi:MAG: class I SAM-dependent methyltransferase [Nanoarchaeota archaeon]|nr:class I SAM-dependent methyltransferase [Nanoarchaeota archaeon]
MTTQKQVWNEIAPEWYKFKTEPAEHVFDFLKTKTGKVLDFGSGAGRHLKKIKKGKMYLVDFSEKMIKLAKKRAKERKIDAEFCVSDVKKLPFEKNTFDSAIAIAIFHCLKPKDHKKAAKELFRVLKPGAQAEIAVWNKNSKRFKNAGKEKYVRWRDKGIRYYYLFDEKEIHNLFKKAGFKIVSKQEPSMKIVFIAQKPKR